MTAFKEAYHARKATGLCGCCGKLPRRKDRSCCEPCAYGQRKYLVQLRKDAVAAYGGRCQCPGGCDVDTEAFLSIDHVNDDGAEHRKEIGTSIYRWLKKNNYPKDGFRLLCYNCNIGRANSAGVCPHEHASAPSLETEIAPYQLLNPAKGYRKAAAVEASALIM